jgi:hypothetical protein
LPKETGAIEDGLAQNAGGAETALVRRERGIEICNQSDLERCVSRLPEADGLALSRMLKTVLCISKKTKHRKCWCVSRTSTTRVPCGSQSKIVEKCDKYSLTACNEYAVEAVMKLSGWVIRRLYRCRVG